MTRWRSDISTCLRKWLILMVVLYSFWISWVTCMDVQSRASAIQRAEALGRIIALHCGELAQARTGGWVRCNLKALACDCQPDTKPCWGVLSSPSPWRPTLSRWKGRNTKRPRARLAAVALLITMLVSRPALHLNLLCLATRLLGAICLLRTIPDCMATGEDIMMPFAWPLSVLPGSELDRSYLFYHKPKKINPKWRSRYRSRGFGNPTWDVVAPC